MTKLIALLLILAMAVQVIKPLGLPGLQAAGGFLEDRPDRVRDLGGRAARSRPFD